MISSMFVFTASARRKSIAFRICDALAKSYVYFSPACKPSSSRLGGSDILLFSFVACESQDAVCDAGFAAHIRELLRRHRNRHRPASVAAARPHRAERIPTDTRARGD